jgi:hypothetical protein
VPSAAQRLIELARASSQEDITGYPKYDAQIDRLVYDLYRLSDAEVARVEQRVVQPLARAA